MKRLLGASLISLMLTTSCGITVTPQNQTNGSYNNFDKSIHTIKGNVDWGKSFTTKATINDISPYGTVSLIYPHNHGTMANRTIASGLTDNSGAFSITTGFSPANNEIFVLEVFKRLGGIGNHLMSLRTYIKADTSTNPVTWNSMTTPGITINNKTTALAIISNTEPFDPALTIGTINNGTPGDIPSTSITASQINDVSTLVNNVLGSNYDPLKYIIKSSGTYTTATMP